MKWKSEMAMKRVKGHDLFFGPSRHGYTAVEHIFKNDRIPSNWNAWGYEEKPTPIHMDSGHGRTN